MTLIALNVCPL